ncbi:hypothetical protein phiOC_p063 [Ochrobactrum phage vB_OspM_OC]|nr:hypothetical protein phiOC_p063 [Ochrobactrum phage vB_OspM_OC]
MSTDFNDPNFGVNIQPQEGEGHFEEDEGIKSNVKDYEHPLFSSNGAIKLVNRCRALSNGTEKELSGEIPDKVFQDISKAARSTQVPYYLLLFCCDWEKDLTSRSDGTDSTDIAKKIVGYVNDLRNSLGRDPTQGELFMAFTLKSGTKVKEVLDKAKSNPDDIVTSVGTQKDKNIIKKYRNKKEVDRTYSELMDFFNKRFPNGNVLFKQNLGKVS